ncbi:MAG: CaiB/BaiF CoA-transferase family protein [Cytophagales bacterium]|nr:CoA transferase [Bernardetiaceae bacterium]MDW8211578.1 CaiB/BaiF CoA-transferase family protein [Cytophagales bacterium]
MLPLQGLKVLEFTHAVMGPACGLILADLGAEVIHVEPPEGDPTRQLKGFGTGYFTYYSRNKKSLAVDLKSPEGKEIIFRLVPQIDIVVENFGPGTMERLGYGYSSLQSVNDRLIYCSLKGFLSGPYEKRHAMDEVVQMMGGLAYMTGPPGMPLRAGTSIVDITGGMFGVIGILAALYQRQQTGKGTFVKSALFETTAFLMGQHMAYGAIAKTPVPPMPARVSAWSVYRTFRTADNEQVFIGIISDKHWEKFCRAFNRPEWIADPRLQTNNARIEQRDWLLPAIENMMEQLSKDEIIRRCQEAEIPFAPIARPEDLFDDPHLNAGHSLLLTQLPDGSMAKLPNIPLEYGQTHFDLRLQPPSVGQHTGEILQSLGYSESHIKALSQNKVIAM